MSPPWEIVRSPTQTIHDPLAVFTCPRPASPNDLLTVRLPASQSQGGGGPPTQPSFTVAHMENHGRMRQHRPILISSTAQNQKVSSVFPHKTVCSHRETDRLCLIEPPSCGLIRLCLFRMVGVLVRIRSNMLIVNSRNIPQLMHPRTTSIRVCASIQQRNIFAKLLALCIIMSLFVSYTAYQGEIASGIGNVPT